MREVLPCFWPSSVLGAAEGALFCIQFWQGPCGDCPEMGLGRAGAAGGSLCSWREGGCAAMAFGVSLCPTWRWSQAVRDGQSSPGASQAPQRSQSSLTARGGSETAIQGAAELPDSQTLTFPSERPKSSGLQVGNSPSPPSWLPGVSSSPCHSQAVTAGC